MSAAALAPDGVRVVDVINLSTSADTLLRERVLALRARGFDNHIVCMDGPRVEPLRALGIPVHTAPMPRGLAPAAVATALRATAHHLRRLRPDVVHTHCSVPGFIGRVAARAAGVPVIVHTVHGFHFHDDMPWLERAPFVLAERLCGAVTDTLLSQNRGDLEQAERYGIGPRDRRLHIGNGIDLTRFAPVPSRSRSMHPVTLTCIARFEPVKHHEQLLDAVALLHRRGLAFRLRLVGDGPLRAACEARCAQLAITGIVEFMGYRQDIPALLADTDIAVLTSAKEGLPRAIIEPMAMGLPVVATRVPGTRELVRDGESGLLVPFGDVEALANALASLILAPSKRGLMGEKARRIALDELDEQRIVALLEALYLARVTARRGLPLTVIPPAPRAIAVTPRGVHAER